MGDHPCPHCLIAKCQIPELGRKLNMRHCQTQIHQDTIECQQLVIKARKMLFQKGYSIKSDIIEHNLHQISATLTMVCVFLFFIASADGPTECLLRTSWPLWI